MRHTTEVRGADAPTTRRLDPRPWTWATGAAAAVLASLLLRRLPSTGWPGLGSTLRWVPIELLLVAAGVLLILSARRRRAGDSPPGGARAGLGAAGSRSTGLGVVLALAGLALALPALGRAAADVVTGPEAVEVSQCAPTPGTSFSSSSYTLWTPDGVRMVPVGLSRRGEERLAEALMDACRRPAGSESLIVELLPRSNVLIAVGTAA